MSTQENNYVVGRGRLFFGQFKPSTRIARAQLYFGNTPELSLAQSEDTLDHFSSEGGVRIKDASVTLQNDSTGSFQCDNISPENLALWFLGEVASRVETGTVKATGTFVFSTGAPAEGDSITINGIEITYSATAGPNVIAPLPANIAATADATAAYLTAMSSALGVRAVSDGVDTVTLTAIEPGTNGNAVTTVATFATPANVTVSGATLATGADVTENFTEVELGRWIQLGRTVATPQGIRGVGSVKITGAATSSYTVEPATGRVLIHADAPDIVPGGTIAITYGIEAQTETVVIAKGTSVEGELQYIADNPAGRNDDYFWPYIKLTPDGDFSLKSDEWQTVNWTLEILKRDDATQRQYITRR